MIYETGYWSAEQHKIGHVFSYKLAKYISSIFDEKKPINDFGCGNGSYCEYLQDLGFVVSGYEGVRAEDTGCLVIYEQDLTVPFNVSEKGNSICLEVGEHIPEVYTNQFLDNLAENTNGLLFMSWGVPGQGGDGHVSCRQNIWVIAEMVNRGFTFDYNKSLRARHLVENYCSWFKDTILIFDNGRS